MAKFVKWLLLIVASLSLVLTLFLLIIKADSPRGPVGIIVPHHDMVASARAGYLKEVGEKLSPKTVVLLSPDHFGTSRTPLTASTRVWTTAVGNISPDLNLIEALAIPQDKADFKGEHGVTTILRDIKTYFPDSLLVPIIVKTNISLSEMNDFISGLYKECPSCLLIASVDFSHTVEADVANLHDTLTLRELEQSDAEALYSQAEVDAPASLAGLALWAKLHKAEQFSLFSHTNSGYISGRPVGEMTTHIIGGYSGGKSISTKADTVTLMFGGDTMFARGVEAVHQTDSKNALVGSLGERFFWGVDIAMVNLEGVFSEDEDLVSGLAEFPPKLKFRPIFVEALQEARIKAIGTANNHSFDGGEVDYEYTQALAKQKGVVAVGNRNGNDPEILLHKEGETKIAIMTYAFHTKSKDLAPKITEYKEAGYYVVVFAHFGREEMLTPTPDQISISERWVDAGASLIVGSHPHVVQPVSVYKGVPIIYSLGNLLFDQTQSEEVQTGAVLGVTVTPREQELFLVPVSSYLRPKVLDKTFPLWVKEWQSYKNQEPGQNYVFPRP